MKICDRVYIVGSGDAGFSISHYRDCTVFLVDGGSELALIDAGIGEDYTKIIDNIRKEGFDPKKVNKILLTHGHADHSGGAWALSRALDAEVFAAADTARFVTDGDVHAIALFEAKQARAYEQAYEFHACPVTPLDDEADIHVGDLTLKLLETPGHCDGHASYYSEHDGRRILFGGDLVFPFGRVILQNIWDCRIPEHAKSMNRIKALKINSLFCAHAGFMLERGYKAVEAACEAFDGLGVPAGM